MDWDKFGKYVGIQGILGFLLVTGYIFMSINGRIPTPAYENLMFGVVGFYFAKNGVSLIQAWRCIPPARRATDEVEKG